MRLYIRLWSLLVLCLLSSGTIQAQPGRDTFGRNRIQYKNFDWRLYSTSNFNVYFYKGGEKGARQTAEYAERELKRITSLIGYYPYSKITFILYNSVTDLKQSNIGLNSDQFETGGETLFLKNKVELAFEGTQTEFKRNLSYRLTELLLSDMMYGGSLKEALQSSYLLRLPDWFVHGVAAYTAEGWSIKMDNYVRDVVLRNPNQRPEMFFKNNQELAGHSVWNYIAERYGYTAIQNILNLTRITRDVEIGITSSLNIPYKRFLQEWYRYYTQVNTRSDNPLVTLPDDKKLFQKNKKELFYSRPVLNPAGTLLAYTENENGNYKVIVQDVRNRRSRVVWKGGYKVLDQQVDYKLPVLAWRNNTQLGLVEARRGQMVLRQINAEKGTSAIPFYDDLTTPAIILAQFSQVRDMHYAEGGRNIVVSAVRNGQADIFLLTANGRLEQQLTNDIYDDIEPVFVKGTDLIAFSSNRWVDSTGTVAEPDLAGVVNNYDIFLLQRTGRTVNVQQVTSSISSELLPKATADGNLVYLSEESGIRSIYHYNLATGEKKPLTNFAQDIEEYDYRSINNTLAVIAKDQARRFVYLMPAFTPTTLETLPKTARQVILETRARNTAAATPGPAQKLLENNNTSNNNAVKPKREGEVNIDNYQFDSDKANTTTTQQERPVVRRPATAPGVQVAGPINYDLRFSVQEIITSVYADPQLGFGIVGGVNMSDLFEDHHIRGSAFIKTDLQTSRFFSEYMNLKKRYDLGVQFKRDIIVTEEQGARLRLAKHEFSPVVIYPLSHSASLRLRPTFVNARFSYVSEFAVPDSVNNFGGGTMEFVYDNSIATGVNMLEGTRMKMGVLTLKGISNSGANFSKFYIDLRRYQKLHRQIVLAGRLSYGAFFGNAPKSFLIGGMDNWLFPSDQDETGQNDVIVRGPADIFFLQYVTPLRGFGFNTRTGSKYMMGNLELRVPIIQYLYDGQIGSGFLRNLQLTSFFDAGTAYNGTNPFTGNNSINRRIVGGENPFGQNPFEVTVINYRNPFLIGYGVGARSTLFGVYGKIDVAWGEEDYKRVGPKFYLTLGYDF